MKDMRVMRNSFLNSLADSVARRMILQTCESLVQCIGLARILVVVIGTTDHRLQNREGSSNKAQLNISPASVASITDTAWC